jgi:hypothetical protein
MRKLRISKSLALPVDAVTQRISILGRTRSGKSHTAGVIVEEVLKARQQVVILDPKGDWWGLRSSADGRSAGLPITIMGGKKGDIPLEPTAGALIADILINEGISLVLDLSLFDSKADEVRFVTAFLDRLYRKNTEPILLVVDEADVFAPQKPEKNETIMLNRMETICRRGAGRGIGVLLISQRSAALHKGCLSQTELMVAHQTTAPQDKDAIKEWVTDHGDAGQRESFMTRIPKLKTGTAITWSPSWLEIYEEVAIRRKETYDSGDAPRVGKRRRAPKVLARVDLERLKKHMSETIEKAKQEDPKLLRVEIQKLKAEIAAKRPPPAPVPKPAPVVAQAPIIRDRVVEVPALKKGQIKELHKLVERMEKARASLGWSTQSLETGANMLSQALGRSVEAVERVKRKPEAVPTRITGTPQNRLVRRPQQTAPATRTPKNGDGQAELLAGERKMLEVLAQFHPGTRTKSQLGALSGYTPSGGTFGNYFGTLRRNKLIREDVTGAIVITEAGLDWFGSSRPRSPATTDELLEMWRGKLLAGERKMLDTLVEKYPETVSKEALGEETGYTHTGGTFGNYLGTLRRNALATVEDDQVKASDAIFELSKA